MVWKTASADYVPWSINFRTCRLFFDNIHQQLQEFPSDFGPPYERAVSFFFSSVLFWSFVPCSDSLFLFFEFLFYPHFPTLSLHLVFRISFCVNLSSTNFICSDFIHSFVHLLFLSLLVLKETKQNNTKNKQTNKQKTITHLWSQFLFIKTRNTEYKRQNTLYSQTRNAEYRLQNTL